MPLSLVLRIHRIIAFKYVLYKIVYPFVYYRLFATILCGFTMASTLTHQAT